IDLWGAVRAPVGVRYCGYCRLDCVSVQQSLANSAADLRVRFGERGVFYRCPKEHLRRRPGILCSDAATSKVVEIAGAAGFCGPLGAPVWAQTSIGTPGLFCFTRL